MLIRSNPCYRPQFAYSRAQGLILITRRLIIATGSRAWGWA